MMKPANRIKGSAPKRMTPHVKPMRRLLSAPPKQTAQACRLAGRKKRMEKMKLTILFMLNLGTSILVLTSDRTRRSLPFEQVRLSQREAGVGGAEVKRASGSSEALER